MFSLGIAEQLQQVAAPRRLTKNELRAVAHHEAGHAVFSLVLGYHRPVKLVRVGEHIAADGTWVTGNVAYEGEAPLLCVLPREQIVIDALINYAGPLAEFRDQAHRKNSELDDFDAYWNTSASQDKETIVNDCLFICARDQGLNPKVGDYASLAVRQAADKLIDELFERAEALVEEHWLKIRKLAIALQKRGTMTGAEIWELLTAPEAEAA